MDNCLLKVGLTGGIASGKTTVSNLFAQLDVPIIDADEIAHTLVKQGQPALEQIIQAFGSEIVLPNGHLNRAKLRQLVFTDHQQRQRLESILHPLIYQEMLEQIKSLQTAYCLLSIPLLVETQQIDRVDRVLAVDCPIQLQKERLKTRNQLTHEEIERIIQVQARREARLAIANDVIYNDSNLEHLQSQVLILHQQYNHYNHK